MKHWNHKPSKLPDVQRPFDWQDRVVIGGAAVCAVLFLFILVWGVR